MRRAVSLLSPGSLVGLLWMTLGFLGVGCAETSDENRTAKTSAAPAPRTSNQATGITPPTETPSARPRDGGFEERGLEMTAAHEVDYLSMQVTLRRTLSGIDANLGAAKVYSTGDVIAQTADEIVEALQNATAGQVVFVPDRKAIDLSEHNRIRIPRGVTLASTRGNPNSLGALLYTNRPDATLFVAEQEAEVIGLNLMGPDPSRRTYQLERLQSQGGKDGYYFLPTSVGISVEGTGVRVENSELWGWSRAAVAVGPKGSGAQIRHNFIHHNQRHGLGYGVSVDQSVALIEANLFDWFRHCVAGTGRPGTGYEARYNFILANGASHVFDMHGGADREDGTQTAGSWAKIHHNIVEFIYFPAVEIRGTPLETIEIYENQFQNDEPERTIVLKTGQERIDVRDNQYGVTSVRTK